MKSLHTSVAIVVVALMAAFSFAGRTVHGENDGRGEPVAVTTSAKLALRQDMRRLWSDHVIWTRQYAVAAVSDLPDKKAAADRLLRNQDDIGNAITVYYGAETGAKLSVLLREHITIGVAVIDAARGVDDVKYKAATAEWTRNAEDIATFLSKANSNWPKKTLSDMMAMHLSTTLEVVKARLSENWEGDVKAFDAVYDHILTMSDVLTDGIIKQFPERFKD